MKKYMQLGWSVHQILCTSHQVLKGLHLSLDQGVKGGRIVPNFGGGATKILECSPARELDIRDNFSARVGISNFCPIIKLIQP